MAWPFTPLVSFISNSVPKITASFLNSVQSAIGAVTGPHYTTRVKSLAQSRDGVGIILEIGQTMIKDESTTNYTYVTGYSGTLSTSGLSNNTWYYVYLVSTNGVASVEYSTTAPVTGTLGHYSEGPLWKTSDETRRYVCCFRSDGSAAVIPFFAMNGRYGLLPSNPIYLLSGGAGSTSFAATTNPISYGAPPHSWRLHLHVALRDSNGSTVNNVRLRPGSTSLGGCVICDIQAGGVDVKATEPYILPRMGDGEIEWKTAAADGTVDIAITGFEE